jgi:hypothetical protein
MADINGILDGKVDRSLSEFQINNQMEIYPSALID